MDDDDIPVPDEILSMILAMVDPVNLVAARWVRKRWRLYAPAPLPLRRPYMAALAFCGYLEVAQWARANGCPWSDQVCVGFARCGRIDALHWAKNSGCPWDRRTHRETCAAVRGGHTETLEWLWLQGRPLQPHACTSAARGGHLATLQWLRARHCEWDQWTCAAAALGGHAEVIEWARSRGCPWDAWTCANLASVGALETLRWAMAEGCPWDYRVYAFAAENGHWDLIRAVRRGLLCGTRPAYLDHLDAADRARCEHLYRAFAFLCPKEAKAAAAALCNEG
ncbi:hypothetical protein pqer_cds_849 [Pandoravirus quercus]|uniref:Ankyrin repeat domain containing protein n=2 Tax=Pandoravirus TaxID=2060084 RepID=A0A2U7U9Z8_9VIRU|nr:hypothetical protein pqer_cds_849 [Pandoravirus quercus]AVK75271.1 hypothetical protein pqer_cds_849 [Pandoravirus quercus]QBZ81444.1 hypothetical protein pclt_cds_857 [Pandoravirus celtis]